MPTAPQKLLSTARSRCSPPSPVLSPPSGASFGLTQSERRSSSDGTADDAVVAADAQTVPPSSGQHGKLSSRLSVSAQEQFLPAAAAAADSASIAAARSIGPGFSAYSEERTTTCAGRRGLAAVPIGQRLRIVPIGRQSQNHECDNVVFTVLQHAGPGAAEAVRLSNAPPVATLPANT